MDQYQFFLPPLTSNRTSSIISDEDAAFLLDDSVVINDNIATRNDDFVLDPSEEQQMLSSFHAVDDDWLDCISLDGGSEDVTSTPTNTHQYHELPAITVCVSKSESDDDDIYDADQQECVSVVSPKPVGHTNAALHHLTIATQPASPEVHDTSPCKKKSKRKANMVDHSYVDFSLIRDVELFPDGNKRMKNNHSDGVNESMSFLGSPVEFNCDIGIAVQDGSDLSSNLSDSSASIRRGSLVIHEASTPLTDTQTGSATRMRTSTFPKTLMWLLDEVNDCEHILSWLPHGRAFLVKNVDAMTSHVLPKYFRQTKYKSFVRQLNKWGFKRITRGTDAGAYYHQLFLRGYSNLVSFMKYTKVKGTGNKMLAYNPDDEPDFYALAQVRPLVTISNSTAQQQNDRRSLHSERSGSSSSGVIAKAPSPIISPDESNKQQNITNVRPALAHVVFFPAVFLAPHPVTFNV